MGGMPEGHPGGMPEGHPGKGDEMQAWASAEEGLGGAAPVRSGRAAPGDGSRLDYGAVRPGDSGKRLARRSDRLGATLGTIAVVALFLGLAQVSDVGRRRVQAAGAIGPRTQALNALPAGVRRAASAQPHGLVAGRRLGQLRVARAGMPHGLSERAGFESALAAGEPAGSVDLSPDSKCCACPAPEATSGGDAGVDAGVDAGAAGPASAESTTTAAGPAPAEAGPEAARTVPGGLQQRKLLQEGAAGAANVTGANANGTLALTAAGEERACCPCASSGANAQDAIAREVPVAEDWSKDALPRTWWDSAFGVLKFVGKGVWVDGIDNGYNDVRVTDGERVVPKPRFPEHKNPWIGPRDIMVPSLEYEGEDHIGGWNLGTHKSSGWSMVGQNVGEVLPHNKDVENLFVDKNVDQRITYMDDSHSDGQLPGVTVRWDRIPHPAEAARMGPPTERPRHFVLHGDGTVTQEAVPDGASVRYRSPGLRNTVFKPCKGHPKHGCELDPPMPQLSTPPAGGALPPIAFTENSFLEDESAKHAAAREVPKFIVNQEGRRFEKTLFDQAAKLDTKPGPINAEDVRALETEYAAHLDQRPWNQLYLNVFEYMDEVLCCLIHIAICTCACVRHTHTRTRKSNVFIHIARKQEYDVTSNASTELKRVLRDHHYAGKVLFSCIHAHVCVRVWCLCVCVCECNIM